jgi:carbonic anhydrase
MRKLILGNLDFQKNVRPKVLETFQKLATGQNPDALFITCCDSRVMPNYIASTDPGDLFVLRNIGNMIPPYDFSQEQFGLFGECAALEYAINVLKVKDLIVCGHSGCGAMQAVLNSNVTTDLTLVRKWLKLAKPSYEKFLNDDSLKFNATISREDKLSQINVVQQLSHLMTYPLVYEAVQEERIALHGWWFNIKDVSINVFVPEENRFLVLDEVQANRILKNEGANTL